MEMPLKKGSKSERETGRAGRGGKKGGVKDMFYSSFGKEIP